MKFTTIITEKKEITKEYDLPYYSKNGNYYYKVISENTCLTLWKLGNYNAHICLRTINSEVEEALRATPCTRLEFDIAHLEVLNLLSDANAELPSVEEIIAETNA